MRLNKYGDPTYGLKNVIDYCVHHPDTNEKQYWADSNLLPWSRLPKEVDPESIQHLVVYSPHTDLKKALPRYLRGLPNLRSVAVPSQVCEYLSSDDIPDSVNFLDVTTRYDSKAGYSRKICFSPDAFFPNVQELDGSNYCYRCETRFVFSAETFPNLEVLGLTLEPKRRMYEQIEQLTKLKLLKICGFDSTAELAYKLEATASRLKSLAVAGKHCHPTIDGIRVFQSLKYLKFIGFSKLTDISEVAHLERLESFGIYWCKRIKNLDAVFKLSKLKRLAMFGNEGFYDESLRAKFLTKAKKRGIDTASCI